MVREYAVDRLHALTDEEFQLILIQLVQVNLANVLSTINCMVGNILLYIVHLCCFWTLANTFIGIKDSS